MADDRAKADIERLVADHHEAVYRYAFRLTGAAPEAEDLTQQVFLVAQERLGQLRKPASARGWLFTILRNAFLKTAVRRDPLPASAIGLNLDNLPTETKEDEAIDAAELQEALKGLPPEFRVVVLMFYFEECSYREISAGLDLPIGTVMSRLARAKRHLRAKLFPPGPQPRRKPQRSVIG